MSTNRNLAYDLSQFETKRPEVVKPKLHVVEKKNMGNPTVAVSTAAGYVIACAVIFSIIAMILYTNALINEVGIEVSNQNEIYGELVAQNEKMRTDIEQSMSIREVESFARDSLGMDSIESYQIEYINMTPTDEIEVAKAPEKSGNIISTILGKLFS